MKPSKRLNPFDPDNPCSNTLIHCSLCPATASNDPRTIWQYNAPYDMAIEHAEQKIPLGMLVSIFISKKEEDAIRIDCDTTASF